MVVVPATAVVVVDVVVGADVWAFVSHHADDDFRHGAQDDGPRLGCDDGDSAITIIPSS